MKQLALFAPYVFFICTATAQAGKEYPVMAGEIPKDVLPQQAQYLMPVFKEGVVLMKNGKVFKNQLNFNLFQNEMHFIGAKNDTLAVADPALIRMVAIDSIVFYFDNGYLREFFKTGKFKLAVKEEMVPGAPKQTGYDVNSGAAKVNYYLSNADNIELYRLNAARDVLYKQQFSYYIGDAFDHFSLATKKNFNRYFSKKNIAGFVKENNINFDKAEDIEALLKFCME